MTGRESGHFRFELSGSQLSQCDDICRRLLNLPESDDWTHLSALLLQIRLMKSRHHPYNRLSEVINATSQLGEFYVELQQHLACHLRLIGDIENAAQIEGEIFVVSDDSQTNTDDILTDEKSRYRLLFEQASVGVVFRSVTSERIFEINDKYLQLIGRSRADVPTLRFRDITLPDDQQIHDELDTRMKRNEIREYSVEKRYLRKDGRVVCALVTCRAVWIPGQQPSAIIAIAQDITESRILSSVQSFIAGRHNTVDDSFLQQLTEKVSEQLNGARVCITETLENAVSLEQQVIASSDRTHAEPGLRLQPASQLTDCHRDEPFALRRGGAFRQPPESITAHNEHAQLLFNWVAGENRPLGLLIIEPLDASQKSVCEALSRVMVASIRAEIINKRNQQKIWHQANYDSLTGVPNRRLIRSLVEQEIKNIRRSHYRSALMLLDLDDFKEINDTIGHNVGDKLLSQVADRLRGVIRESDYVGRLGGDEFVVLVSAIRDESDLVMIACKIQGALSEQFMIEQHALFVGSSIGITLLPDDGDTVDNLFINADQAMYASKARGKNQFSFFSRELNANMQRRSRLTQALRTALQNNELYLEYQPILDVRQQKFTKAEALLRWRNPELGMISPAEFIPIAESTGLIHSIGGWVFLNACEKLAQLQHEFMPDFKICINKSPVQFRSVNEKYDYSGWIQHLETLGIDPSSVIVEITEGVFIDTSLNVAEIIENMRKHGLQFAIDDFGAGYSSLAYLRNFGMDYLKIDQQFVSSMQEGSDDFSLCKAIVVMAHELNIQVVAEGVETASQYRALTAMGVDFLQGYFLSRPMSYEALQTCIGVEQPV